MLPNIVPKQVLEKLQPKWVENEIIYVHVKYELSKTLHLILCSRQNTESQQKKKKNVTLIDLKLGQNKLDNFF